MHSIHPKMDLPYYFDRINLYKRNKHFFFKVKKSARCYE